jgi:hypothetical protein
VLTVPAAKNEETTTMVKTNEYIMALNGQKWCCINKQRGEENSKS